MAFVVEHRQKAAAKFDAPPPKEKKDVDREEWIEHVVAENLTTAVEELFNEHLLEVHPDLFGFYLNFDPADTNAYDPEKLIEGLATCAWCEVHCDVIAEALMLYAKNLAAEAGVHRLPDMEQEGQ